MSQNIYCVTHESIKPYKKTGLFFCERDVTGPLVHFIPISFRFAATHGVQVAGWGGDDHVISCGRSTAKLRASGANQYLRVRVARNAHDPKNVFHSYVTEMLTCPRHPQFNFCYVTLVRSMPMPTLCFLVHSATLLSHGRMLPKLRYKSGDSAKDRTWSLRLRRATPYPLGHRTSVGLTVPMTRTHDVFVRPKSEYI